MTTTTRCEGRIPDTNIAGDRCDFQCYETAVACPKCEQMTQFCLECMRLSSESEPMCEECDGKRLELVRASTPENVERLVEAHRALVLAIWRLINADNPYKDGLSDDRYSAEDIRRNGQMARIHGRATIEHFDAALAPFKGVKP